jgi:hypothetical protein
MKRIFLFVFLLFPSIAIASNVGDTRETKDGIEKCIGKQGKIEAWALITPNVEYLKGLATDRVAQEQKDAATAKSSLALNALVSDKIKAMEAVK